MVIQYSNWLNQAELKHTEDLKPGKGGVMNLGMKQMMVYRDQHGLLHTCAATYPYLGTLPNRFELNKTNDCSIPIAQSKSSSRSASMKTKKVNCSAISEHTATAQH